MWTESFPVITRTPARFLSPIKSAASRAVDADPGLPIQEETLSSFPDAKTLKLWENARCLGFVNFAPT